MAEYIFINESKSSSYTSSSSGDESEYDTYESDSSSNEDGRGEIQPYMFEPRRAVQVDANGDETMEEDQSHQRLGDLDW